jgi:rubredoxin
MSRRGQGRGRGGSRQFTGGPKDCVCPKCGAKVPHVRGVPCLDTSCPNCGSKMLPSS